MAVDLTNPRTETIGERCVITKGRGNNAGGWTYCSIRTSGHYGQGDGDTIKNGTGATASQYTPNDYDITFMFNTLNPGTTYYWGMVAEEGGAYGIVLTGSFTTLTEQSDYGSIPIHGAT